MNEDRIDIFHFFDPHNPAHIRAYQYFKKNGSWPKNFIPEGCRSSTIGLEILANILADKWINYILKEKGYKKRNGRRV